MRSRASLRSKSILGSRRRSRRRATLAGLWVWDGRWGFGAASVACGKSTNHGMYECCRRRVDACREIIRAAGDFTKQVASEMITGSAETVQQAVQSGAEIAARMTEYSAANINAIVKSNVDLVDVTRTLSRNWVRFVQEGIERGFDWSRCLLQSRAVSTLPISRKKPCALVLMPFSDTRNATSPCVPHLEEMRAAISHTDHG